MYDSPISRFCPSGDESNGERTLVCYIIANYEIVVVSPCACRRRPLGALGKGRDEYYQLDESLLAVSNWRRSAF